MRREWPEDPRSSEELLEAHRLEREDEDSDWAALVALRDRGGRHEFEMGRRLTESEVALDRVIGTDLLAQLDSGKETFRDEVVPILIHLLNDSDPAVISSAAVGLGHRQASEAVGQLVELAEHPDPDVRQGVVFGLLTQEDERAIATLIKLTKDEDVDVRSWATFGLGTQIGTDTQAIRDALAACLNDPDSEVRGECLVGLANRHDKRATEALPLELERDDVGALALQAAETLGDRSLVPHLKKLLSSQLPDDDEYFRNQLLDAIASCESGGSHRTGVST